MIGLLYPNVSLKINGVKFDRLVNLIQQSFRLPECTVQADKTARQVRWLGFFHKVILKTDKNALSAFQHRSGIVAFLFAQYALHSVDDFVQIVFCNAQILRVVQMRFQLGIDIAERH